jgi:hypothetical protein
MRRWHWLDDLIMRAPPVTGTWLCSALYRLLGIAYPTGGVSLDMRLAFINPDAARRSLARLPSWDFDRLVIAHGACIEHGARPFVERAFRWLTPTSAPT